MSMLFAAVISFVSFWLMLRHFSPKVMRRVVGYMWVTDLVLHGTILYLFFGTSTLGLIQAEAAGICFSLYLRWYRWAWGFERLHKNGRWYRYHGRIGRHAT